MVKSSIEQALTQAGCKGFVVERPARMEHGDYSTNAALVGKVDPHELAGRLKVEGVEKIEVVGKFINFWISKDTLAKMAVDIAEEEIPKKDLYKGKRILLEYTDPNPFKEFHIGHLMSNAIGESIARLLEYSGADVRRANYQGNVGLHVAKAVWGKTQQLALNWGEAYVYGNEKYESNKEAIDEVNKKIYEEDNTVMPIYEAGLMETMKEFEKLYEVLGMRNRDSDKEGLVHFDNYFYESEAWKRGKKIVEEALGRNIFEKSDGAVIFRGENYGLHTRVFITSAGLPTYETKEIGLFELKQERLKKYGTWKAPPDISIVITANEIKEYFKVVLKAAEKIGGEIAELASKTKHITHGVMKLTSGKMSSRTGGVITADSLIKELQERARGRQEVAVGAVKYAVLKQGSGKDIVFDPEKSLSLEGNSGPYLQYARVRALSILKKVQPESVMPHVDEKGYWVSLARILIHYPDVVARAAEKMEPHLVTTYLTELAAAFNSLYGAQQFIVEGKILRTYLILVKAFEHTMVDGLDLLGIPAPEEM